MSARDRSAARLLLPASGVLGALGLVAAALLVLGQRGALLVHQCVSDGGAGWLGLRLALLRREAGCPDGTLAVGPDTRQAIAVVVMVAVPVLLAHLLAAAAGLGVARHVGQVVRIALRLLRRPFRARPLPVALVVRLLRRPAASRAVRAPGPVDVAVPLRRGPPLQLA